jgi:hypothetical protein
MKQLVPVLLKSILKTYTGVDTKIYLVTKK